MQLTLKRMTIALALVSFLAACADKGDQTKGAGAALGAVGGAIVGAAIGYATNGPKGALAGAVAGAAVGGIAGYAVGYHVVERQKEYASKEDRLDGELKYAIEQNGSLKQYNAETTGKIKELQAQLKNAKSTNKQLRATAALSSQDKEKYQEGIKKDKENIAKLNTELAALTEYQKSIKKSGGDAEKKARLGDEIRVLKGNIAMLNSNNNQLAQVVNSFPVNSL
jgi:mannitol-specific phosphotransferase system IIBC component